MSSDFEKVALDVDRHYSQNWFTRWSSNLFTKHNFTAGYHLAEWLVGYANMLRSASPRDGYEWVDRRTSAWSQMDDRQKIREIESSIMEEHA
jgi:hypothetical protein